jgi:hypothetical protein
VSKADGRIAARYLLESPPVFDGLVSAAGRLYLSTMDGAVRCIAPAGPGPAGPAAAVAGAPALRREDPAEPAQVASDEPEEPGYLKPPEVDLSAEFDVVSRCRVARCELGYRLVPGGKKQTSLALKRLPEPRTGSFTLAARMRVPETPGFLANGFLALGDGSSGVPPDRLVQCGIRFRTKKALVVEGALGGGGRTTGADVSAPVGKVVDLRIRVDLAARKLAFEADGTTVEAELTSPIDKVTHVGYATDDAVAEFGAVVMSP